MQAPTPPTHRSRSRIAGLRLPDLPPRDLERLAAGPHSAPVPSSTPNSATYTLPPPITTPTKFGGEGSPADVRAYSAAAPLLMRGGVVSPSRGGGSGLVLPNLSLPLSGNILPPVASVPLHSNLPHVPPIRSRVNPRGGVRTTPSSPVTTGMTPNEIKKAQNRKSAKRFREAQKQRWKNMADDLMNHKRTIDELRAQLASQAASVQEAKDALRQHNKDKRSAMSINDLVEPSADSLSTSTTSNTQGHAEAEAALYAQVLSNTSQKSDDASRKQPYVSDLGLLTVCVVVISHTAKVVSVRRGNPTSFGTLMTDGLAHADANEFRTALACKKPVAVVYSRRGMRVNAVMNPIPNSDRVVVAEFAPF